MGAWMRLWQGGWTDTKVEKYVLYPFSLFSAQ